MTDQYVTASKAAEMLGVSSQAIRDWIRTGEIKGAYQLNPHRKTSPFLVPVGEVEKIINQRKKQAGLIEK